MGPKRILGLKKKFEFGKILGRKNFCSGKMLGLKKILVQKKILVPKKIWVWKKFWVDFGGVILVLLVTWAIRTPNPLNSASLWFNFQCSSTLPSDRFWCGGSCCSCDSSHGTGYAVGGRADTGCPKNKGVTVLVDCSGYKYSRTWYLNWKVLTIGTFELKRTFLYEAGSHDTISLNWFENIKPSRTIYKERLEIHHCENLVDGEFFSCDEQLKKWCCHLVCLCVCLSVFPFFSSSWLDFLECHIVDSVISVWSSPKEVQWCFQKVSRVFEVSRIFQGSFKDVSRKF